MTVTSTVVVVHAHPDDEAIFTGATIVRLARHGVRVVLVAATCGEQGDPRVRLRRGESIQQRRRAELERSCDLLGVQRLVLLGYADSGADRSGGYADGSLAAAAPGQVARRLAAVVEQESATTLIHYDTGGIYGHPDHVRVHQAGARLARRLALTCYEATVDADHLHRQRRHVLHAAAYPDTPLGVRPEQISVTLDATPSELAAKRAAMTAHTSQIDPDHTFGNDFAAGYAREWFVRRGPLGVLDRAIAAVA
jgi:LmbE family N-acetylglucosaminyl deacetylase